MRLLRPPALSTEELSLAARVTHRVILATCAVVFFSLVILIALQPETGLRRLFTIVIIFGIGAFLLVLNDRGRPRLAAAIWVLALTLVLTFRCITSGGASAPALGGFLVITMIASLMLGLRGGLLIAGLHAVLALGLALAEQHGLLPLSELEFPPIILWVYLCYWLGLTIVLQMQISSAQQDSLVRIKSELAERRRAEQRLQVALETGKIAMWELDHQTHQVIGDERLFKLLGLPPAPDGVLPQETWSSRIHPDDYGAINDALLRLKQAGDEVHVEFRVLRPDSGTRHVEGIGALVPAVAGNSAKVVGMSIDVTARHTAEAERAALIDNLAERVKELNFLHQAARLLRQDRSPDETLFQELVGLMPAAFHYNDDCEARITFGTISVTTPQWTQNSAATLRVDFTASTGVGTLEVGYLNPHPPADEGPFLKEEKALLVSLADMLVSFIDRQRKQEELEMLVEGRTRELKTSYERLKELEQLRDDLVNMVVHDMRSPLSVVIMRLDLLKFTLGAQLSTDAGGHLQGARDSADTVVRMACDLLDVSRLEENKLSLNLAPVDLAELCRTKVQTLSQLDTSRRLEFEAAKVIEATCDAGLIGRVIENLIGNAIKHTAPGTAVRVAVNRLEHFVRVAISDQGKGIPLEAQGKLFQKFSTLANRSEMGYHSVGLGLVFCKMAVEAHGGVIGVDSEVGRGSTFYFDLPVT